MSAGSLGGGGAGSGGIGYKVPPGISGVAADHYAGNHLFAVLSRRGRAVIIKEGTKAVLFAVHVAQRFAAPEVVIVKLPVIALILGNLRGLRSGGGLLLASGIPGGADIKRHRILAVFMKKYRQHESRSAGNDEKADNYLNHSVRHFWFLCSDAPDPVSPISSGSLVLFLSCRCSLLPGALFPRWFSGG